MGKVWVLKEPKSDRSWNLYALREAAKLKKWLQGVYYSPSLKRLLVVFKPTPGTHMNRLVFEEIGESVLRDAFKMICPEGCSRCCVAHSGAFILENEVNIIPDDEIKTQIMMQPSEVVRTPGGPVRVYYLGTKSLGRCIFLNPRTGKCILEEKFGKSYKPIICLITYCTVFAERNGEKYIKTGFKLLGKGVVELYYRRVSDDEFKEAVNRMGSMLRKLRKALPIIKQREKEQNEERQVEVSTLAPQQTTLRRRSREEVLRYRARFIQRPDLLKQK